MKNLVSIIALAAFSVALPPPGARPCWGQEDRASETDGATETEQVKPPSIDEWLLFFPSKHPLGDWAPKNLRYQDVFFASEDGTRLHGWFCPCDSPRATILIAHGNAGHVASRAAWLRHLQTEAQVTTFLFDYRGYGRSEGVPTVEGILQDAEAARAKLCELTGLESSELLLMGESLGGAVVVQLAADSAPRGLVLQSTFASLRDVADVHFPKLSWLVPVTKLNSVSKIQQFHGPLLQSHGKADRTIPFASGLDLFRAAHEPKTFVAIDHAGHNNWLSAEYLNYLDAFISRLDRSAVSAR